MGQEQNKTYTAPDGSVFRIEADGSITKIKEGRTALKESPSQYQIADDGRIYRVEQDGSVTFVGMIGEQSNASQPPRYSMPIPQNKTSNNEWLWVMVVITTIVIFGSVFISVIIKSGGCAKNVEEIPHVYDGPIHYFDRYDNREYWSTIDNTPYLMRFYDNGKCDLYIDGEVYESGRYIPNGDNITFEDFLIIDSESVTFDPDDTFLLWGNRFHRSD